MCLAVIPTPKNYAMRPSCRQRARSHDSVAANATAVVSMSTRAIFSFTARLRQVRVTFTMIDTVLAQQNR